MSRLIRPVVFLLASCTAFSATPARSPAGGAVELAINGVSCGRVFSFEGGDPRTNVVVERPAGAALPKKHVAGVDYAPITVEVNFPPAQPILDWIGDLCANRQTRKTLLLKEYDAGGSPVGTSLQATGTLLKEVRFPALDASSKDAAHLTLVFSPESTQASASTSASPAATNLGGGVAGKAALLANFRIQVGNLPAGSVSRIEAFSIKQAVVGTTVGEREPAKESGATEFSNLVLTLKTTDLPDWATWRDNFVVKGANGDANETSGSLQLLAADMTPLFALQFSHVGILRVSPEKIQTGTDTVPKFQAEIYCESMAPGTSSTSSAAAAKGGRAAGGAAAAAAGSALPPKDTASLAPNISVAPVAATPPPPAGTTDQGARDPKDFPRPDGSIRKSYSAVRQTTYSQEIVAYSSKDTLDGLEKFYTDRLTAAGWELGIRVENDGSLENRHQMILNWKNGLRSVAITLADMKAGGSGIAVTLITKFAP